MDCQEVNRVAAPYFVPSVRLGLSRHVSVSSLSDSRSPLFTPTEGLSPATGVHAGKWVTVNPICLPHICSPAAPSTCRRHDTSTKNKRDSEQKGKLAAETLCSAVCFAELQREDVCAAPPPSCSCMMDRCRCEREHVWSSKRPAG